MIRGSDPEVITWLSHLEILPTISHTIMLVDLLQTMQLHITPGAGQGQLFLGSGYLSCGHGLRRFPLMLSVTWHNAIIDNLDTNFD